MSMSRVREHEHAQGRNIIIIDVFTLSMLKNPRHDYPAHLPCPAHRKKVGFWLYRSPAPGWL
jgi:hypothetical protein